MTSPQTIQLLIQRSAEHFGVVVRGDELFREVFVYYTAAYAGPDGNISNSFLVSDTNGPPVVDGVPIPNDFPYVVRKELEIDFSMMTLEQFQGVIGK